MPQITLFTDASEITINNDYFSCKRIKKVSFEYPALKCIFISNVVKLLRSG